MGSMISKNMSEVMDKNIQNMKEMQLQTMERQIQMQNQMRERMMAMQIARAREMLNWWGSFYALALVAGIAGFKKSGNPAPLVPILPLTFIVGYQADMCYFGKFVRIREMADDILTNEPELYALPKGLPTLQSIEEARLRAKEQAEYAELRKK